MMSKQKNEQNQPGETEEDRLMARVIRKHLPPLKAPPELMANVNR